MVFVIESIAACALFTVLVEIVTLKKREVLVNDYPPVVIDKLRQIGLIAEKPPAKRSDIIRKFISINIYAVLFAFLLRYVNGITTFREGAMTAYALWLVVDWYDFLFVDVLFAPFDKYYKRAGISAFDKSAVWFHCRASIRGMIIGIIFAPVVGYIVMLL